jgi:hypothetical protein
VFNFIKILSKYSRKYTFSKTPIVTSLESIFGLVDDFEFEIMKITNGAINYDNIKNLTINECNYYINQCLSSTQNEYDAQKEREKLMKK